MSNPDYKTSTLLAAIKADATDEYKSRVPDATQSNLAEVGTAILNYSSTRNEFVSALFNRIGKVIITSKLFNNPLTEFKKGMLDYGKDIEEVFVDLVVANAFSPETAETKLFERKMPDIKAVFHRINRQDFYKTTVTNILLQRAFLSEQGMMSLIDKITSSLYSSDNYDEFLIMKQLVHQIGEEGKFAIEVVSPVTDTATAKAAMVKIKEISNNLTFMAPDYNYAGVKNFTLKEDQIVLIGTKFDALVDVEVLAAAFNMEKAEFIGRRVLVDDFGGLANVLCAVVDKNWFMIYDSLIRTEDIYNPQGLYYNYFLHHHQVISASPFANAVLFVTVAPVLASIDLLPATVNASAGDTIQFIVEATGTNDPPAKSTFTTDATSDNTYISSNGMLVIGSDETTSPLTVTATSDYLDSITDTAVITLV